MFPQKNLWLETKTKSQAVEMFFSGKCLNLGFASCISNKGGKLHPGRLTWKIQITHFERKIIFQTSMIMFHVNLPACTFVFLRNGVIILHIYIHGLK